jgi:alanine racemase
MADHDIDARLARAGLPTLPRGAWLEVDLDALAANLAVLRELVGPRTQVWAVIKADAYGHGIEMAGRTFTAAGAERLCVASLDEALLLRQAGVSAPLLVMFPVPLAGLEDAVAADLDLVASDATGTRELLARWRGTATGVRGGLRLHLEVETGLGRGGVLPADAAALAAEIAATPATSLAGLWTHLAAPEEEAATAAQVEAFEDAARRLRDSGTTVPPRHASSSGGIFAGREALYDAVRPGLALYGLLADDLPIAAGARSAAARLQPAMALKCRPLRVETLPAGSGVSYGGRWRAEADGARIATLPLGYGDGFSRAYWPGGEVLVHGRRVPLVGSVAMDAVMADVSAVPGVGLEDEFVLLGSQESESITAAELARRRNTIPWEVVTAMAHRLPRVYHARAVPLAVRTLLGQLTAKGSPGRGDDTTGEEHG